MLETITLTEVTDVITPEEETTPENYNFAMESTWEETIYSQGGGGGGVTPEGSLDISENGTYDVTDYAEAVVDVSNSYSASDEGKVVDNGALVSQASRTVTENGTYDTTTNDEVVVNVEGSVGAPWTPINSLIIHDGNAFDFDLTIDPLKDKISAWLSEYKTTSPNLGLYNSPGTETVAYNSCFFAIASRNGNYNRWCYNGYIADNVVTNGKPNVLTTAPGVYVAVNLPFTDELFGDGSEGTETTAYPQTETLLHVGGAWDGKRIFRFYIYDTDASKYRVNWIPALDSNGAPCFYDTVSKKFIYNVGTGSVGYVMGGVTYE